MYEIRASNLGQDEFEILDVRGEVVLTLKGDFAVRINKLMMLEKTASDPSDSVAQERRSGFECHRAAYYVSGILDEKSQADEVRFRAHLEGLLSRKKMEINESNLSMLRSPFNHFLVACRAEPVAGVTGLSLNNAEEYLETVGSFPLYYQILFDAEIGIQAMHTAVVLGRSKDGEFIVFEKQGDGSSPFRIVTWAVSTQFYRGHWLCLKGNLVFAHSMG